MTGECLQAGLTDGRKSETRAVREGDRVTVWCSLDAQRTSAPETGVVHRVDKEDGGFYATFDGQKWRQKLHLEDHAVNWVFADGYDHRSGRVLPGDPLGDLTYNPASSKQPEPKLRGLLATLVAFLLQAEGEVGGRVANNREKRMAELIHDTELSKLLSATLGIASTVLALGVSFGFAVAPHVDKGAAKRVTKRPKKKRTKKGLCGRTHTRTHTRTHKGGRSPSSSPSYSSDESEAEDLPRFVEPNAVR